MPTFTPYMKYQLDFALNLIGQAVYQPVAPLEIRAWCTREPLPYASRTQGAEHTFTVGEKWGNLFDCAWFHFTGTVPDSAAGQPVVLLLDVNGEMCVFDEAGNPIRGLTSLASGYDFSLGGPGKRVVPITFKAQGGDSISVWADAGCNDLFGNLQGNGTVKEASIAICNETVRGLFYDYEVLLDFLKVLPEDSPRYQQILAGLTEVTHLLYRGLPAVAEQARAVLRLLLDKRGGDPSLKISAVGHAHMDLGWLWPIRETKRKGARTFSTALANIEKYPHYVFGASQPQYFLWMKENYPALYARIKQKVAEGRIEPQGVMWVEADTNVSGGEALVRQILQGRRFFRQEFGVDVRYLWLPDVFGYNGNLPQILKKAGVDIFATQKLSWSLINHFPHHSFRWQGVDGTTVLAHMFPEDTYNGPGLPRSTRKIEQNYRDSGFSEYALMVFGIGDGGGGPGEEHIERLERIQNLEGLSPVKQEWAAAFFEQWQTQADSFPTWVGELYLERHEGTLTTEARNKWYNRKMELGLRELEWGSVLASLLSGTPYPAGWLQDTWREVLLYQFHDILPGSSIKRVYDESLARYRTLYQGVAERLSANDQLLAGNISTAGMGSPVLVQNSLAWERTEWVNINGKWVHTNVPSMGYQVIDLTQDRIGIKNLSGLNASSTSLENDILKVTFASDGSITSILDKRCGREVIPAGQVANHLAVYGDMGDAWDFPMDYAEQTPQYMELAAAAAHIDGPRAILHQTYRLGHSELVQDIVLTAGSPRLEFNTRLHWRTSQAMLRTSFPVDIHAEEATYDIQFGHIRRTTHRNTTWDLARDEVCAHKWADLSQGDYGVALLNDSKYGHKVKGNVLDLNLLRSVPYPGSRVAEEPNDPSEPNDVYTDQCDHIFTYALYPHQGDHVDGRVAQAGYELNIPLRTMPLPLHAGKLPPRASFLQVEAPNVFVEAVKLAEDDQSVIIRLYEAEHSGAKANLTFGFPIVSAAEVDIMEENAVPLAVANNSVQIEFKPLEIKTIKVSVGK
jgi:alpha-mannosidase